MRRGALIGACVLMYSQPTFAQQPVLRGNWTVINKASELDGSGSYIATVQADKPIASMLNTDRDPAIGVSCDSKGEFISIVWPDFINITHGGFRDYVTVAWRADDGQPQKADFGAVTTGAVMAGRDAQAWLTSLRDAKRVVLRVPDAHGGQETAFNVTGVDQVLADLAARRCGPGSVYVPEVAGSASAAPTPQPGPPRLRFGASFVTLAPAMAIAMQRAGLKGVLVMAVQSGSPAEAAGLQPGDAITEFDGKPIVSAEDMQAAVAGVPPAQIASVRLLRGGVLTSLSATIN